MKPREKFLLLWKANGGPKLDEEHKFHPNRRWKADFRYESDGLSPVHIEIEGGIWLGGRARHTSGVGYWKDCEKYNEALLMGIKVIRLAGPLINDEYVRRLVLWVRGGQQPPAEGIQPPLRKNKPSKNRDLRASR